MPQRPELENIEYGEDEQPQQKGSAWFLWPPSWRTRKADNGVVPQQERQREETVDDRPTASRPTSPKPVALGPRKPALDRQESEARERLCRLHDCKHARRALGKGRRKRAASASADIRIKTPIPRGPFPDIRAINNGAASSAGDVGRCGQSESNRALTEQSADGYDIARLPSRTSSRPDKEPLAPGLEDSDTLIDAAFWEKLEAEWVLCLSMHFRDGSDREKFFVTYIEQRNRWRRVTVSCDYRSVPEDSLESVLKSLYYQRDKNARIYQSIRDSLPDIQFYDTVTNLKLETKEGRLHVHVTEDVNEITQYPPIGAIQHLRFDRNGYLEIRESDLLFESHLSGFVYRVSSRGNIYIKKEISSPDTVEEFLYELNALAALQHSQGVIGLVGVVVDDARTCIRGLLIEWASGGSLNDFLFENQNRVVPWPRRIKWARQIISGIADIHEAGFIQGDCTISNVVLDANDNAKIVDINRRGCPIGWEPPEFEGLIRSAQRVSMYIGVKSDLFQMGMILWAIANQVDEPEREERPLRLNGLETPRFYQTIVRSCLSEDPRERTSAKELLKLFPLPGYGAFDPSIELNNHQALLDNGPISPFSAAEMEDFKGLRQPRHGHDWVPVSESAGLESNRTGLPNYKLQDSLLAGIGPFEEKSGSMKTSEPPIENETSFGVPAKQDSGLDFNFIDDTLDSQDLTDTRLAQSFQSPEILLERNATPSLPVHQDSGFDDSAFAELQTRGVIAVPFAPAANEQLEIQKVPDSGSNQVTGDLLRDLGAHTGPRHDPSDIPRFDTPPPMS